jgi:hypothetical protein
VEEEMQSGGGEDRIDPMVGPPVLTGRNRRQDKFKMTTASGPKIPKPEPKYKQEVTRSQVETFLRYCFEPEDRARWWFKRELEVKLFARASDKNFLPVTLTKSLDGQHFFLHADNEAAIAQALVFVDKRIG